MVCKKRGLIIGDASGVAGVLIQYFERYGVECDSVVTSNPQKRKNIKVFGGDSLIGKLLGQLRFIVWFILFSGKYDFIVSIGYPFLSNLFNRINSVWLRELLIRNAKRKSIGLVYYALGCDPFFAESRSLVCRKCLESGDKIQEKCRYLYQGRAIEASAALNRYYDGVLVFSPPYNVVKKYISVPHVDVHLPFDVDKGNANNTVVGGCRDKIIIVHPTTGRGKRGTRLILDVFKMVSDDFENVECKLIEGLTYDEYCKEITNADILVDQCLGESYGMSAIEGMWRRKVVLANSNVPAGWERPPIVHIQPDVNDIYAKLKEVITLPITERRKLGEAGRSFVLKYHHPDRVIESILRFL